MRTSNRPRHSISLDHSFVRIPLVLYLSLSFHPSPHHSLFALLKTLIFFLLFKNRRQFPENSRTLRKLTFPIIPFFRLLYEGFLSVFLFFSYSKSSQCETNHIISFFLDFFLYFFFCFVLCEWRVKELREQVQTDTQGGRKARVRGQVSGSTSRECGTGIVANHVDAAGFVSKSVRIAARLRLKITMSAGVSLGLNRTDASLTRNTLIESSSIYLCLLFSIETNKKIISPSSTFIYIIDRAL